VTETWAVGDRCYCRRADGEACPAIVDEVHDTVLVVGTATRIPETYIVTPDEISRRIR
jgi:hypothetical protein